MAQNETETGTENTTGGISGTLRSRARAKRLRSLFRMLAAVVVVLSCSDPLVPDGSADRPENVSLGLLESEIDILRIPASAPPLQQTSVSFWAKKGVSRTGKIYFENGSGGQGSEYARLVVGANSLKALPDGTPIAVGDSVLITITVVDTTRTLFSLAPHGLQFNAWAPAKLTLFYTEADHDFDADGDEDLFDSLIELQLGIWRQPSLGALFTELLSLLNLGAESVKSNLTKFSQYAIAY
jgi:hypothetical protein